MEPAIFDPRLELKARLKFFKYELRMVIKNKIYFILKVYANFFS